HASNAATSSQTSVGGGSGAGGSAGGSAGSGITSRPAPGPTNHSGTKFRHGLLQLMIHTIDPLHDVSFRANSDLYVTKWRKQFVNNSSTTFLKYWVNKFLKSMRKIPIA
ncbi:hypothetical protein L9F63_002580, partial [Diploptera punctata]